MTNIEHHAAICKEMTALYEKKNRDYGDSFHKSFQEYGLTMVCIRLEDKLNRMKAITKAIVRGEQQMVEDETIVDTLNDLANYAVMGRMELEGERE